MNDRPSRIGGCCFASVFIIILIVSIVLMIFWVDLLYEWKKIIPGVSFFDRPIEIDPNFMQDFQPIYLFIYCLLGLIFIILLFFLVGYFVPPVHNMDMGKLRLSIQNIFITKSRFVVIKDGLSNPPLSEIRSMPQNVAIIDLGSAAVLEQKLWSPTQRNYPDGLVSYTDGEEFARVVGPGIVLLNGGERIHSTFSLQTQFRFVEEVLGHTIDGVEVNAAIYLLFSITDPPNIIRITSVGDRPDDLRLLVISDDTHRITDALDVLDASMKEEIYNLIGDTDEFLRLHTAPLMRLNQTGEGPPYNLDEGRIANAYYSIANQQGEERNQIDWAGIAVQAAAEVFRNTIARWTFDSLYAANNPDSFPLFDELVPRMRAEIQSLGILAYQFIRRHDWQDPQIGDVVTPTDYLILEPVELQESSTLRDCGISVLTSGFIAFGPADSRVLEQNIDSWRAQWERQADRVRADFDREASQIQSRAKEDAQYEIIRTLSNLFADPDYTEEALAIKFVQTLESFASDSETRVLLPAYTLEMLSELRNYLGMS